MFSAQTIFFFLHILGVITWLGGWVALWILQVRFRKERDANVQLALLRQSTFYGRAVVSAAAAVTFIAGLVLANREDVSLGTAWVLWGVVGLIASMGLGGTLLRTTSERLEGLLTNGTTANDPGLLAAQRRLDLLNLVNLLILLSVVFAMVFKPGS